MTNNCVAWYCFVSYAAVVQQTDKEQPAHQDTRATEAISGAEQERLLAILNFWHKLEFFIPFDLDQRIAEAETGRIRPLRARHLADSSNSLWLANLPDGYELKGFYLYLGIFDKSEITKVCEQAVRSKLQLDPHEEFERTDLEGNTCFARLTISSLGELVFESETISVSTVPWALGQIQAHGLSALNQSAFEQSKEELSELLQSFQSNRKPNAPEGLPVLPKPVSPAEILALYQLFCEWASYSPAGNKPIAVIEIQAAKKKQTKAIDHSSELSSAKDAVSAPGHRATNKKTEREEETEDSEELEPEIGILNSFFLSDLERVAVMVRSGYVPCAFKSYLTPLAPERRLDLDSDEGYWTIFDALHPKRLNAGHWLNEPNRAMSLMQQFAINSVMQPGDPPFLFSVNGPPGTGKTTLLQDIFAEMLVRRARALSCLRQAGEAFQAGSTPVRFSGDSDPTRIVKLKPELTGFEMVVASSNNAAVENISRDLPKSGKSLGTSWPSAKYLQPVAHKIAAQLEDGSFMKLPTADVPWGLISCALGKSSNRRAFKERFSFLPVRHEAKPTWSGSQRPQTIFEWIDEYGGLSFAEAVAHFQSIDQKVQARCNRLSECADLLRDRLQSSDAASISQAEKRLTEAGENRDRIQSEIWELEASRSKLQNSLVALQEDERLIERSSPGWWAKLRRAAAAQLYRKQVQENATAQLQTRRQLFDLQKKYDAVLKPAWEAASRQVAQAEQNVKHTQIVQASKEREWSRMREEFAHLKLPDTLSELRTDDFQKEGLWHEEELARLRSSLFAAALALHEAWLAEVAKKKDQGGAGFRGNIVAVTKLLSNKRPDERAHVPAIWQSLFLMVPVVSTTFASFANQFRDLGPASLGWLFIDEAGQAVPQAAVGALWRAQRAVVVGDPRQIEPVFTLPSRFISTLAELSSYTRDGHYAPHRVSVQRLADHANRYGVNLSSGEETPVWIGSPLRVHRRCIEPMFSWSNYIAYDDRMVFGLENRNKPNGPPIPYNSTWIDIKGKTRKRQEVPEQTQFVVDLMVTLYQVEGKLPCLYVISPFKAVKNELQGTLREADWTRGRLDLSGPKKHELKKWCRERVGTVHTFQGKEEDSVIMVLGADKEHAGAAVWASSKPNILNVALTRAKRRFYMVGDRQLWGEMGSFQLSREKIESQGPDEFLAILRRGKTQGRFAASR